MIRPAISALLLAAGLGGMASAQNIYLADGKDYTRAARTQPAPLRAQTTTRSGSSYNRSYSDSHAYGTTDQHVYTKGSSRNLAGGSYSGGTSYRYGTPRTTYSGSGSYTTTRPAYTSGTHYRSAPVTYSSSGYGSQLGSDGRDTHVYAKGDNCNGRNAHDSGALVGNITGGTRYHCSASTMRRSTPARTTYSTPAVSYSAPRQTYRAPASTRTYSGRSYRTPATTYSSPHTPSYPTRYSANRPGSNTQYPTSSNYSRQSYVSGQRWPTRQTYSSASYPTSYGTSYGTTFTPGAYTGGVGANIDGGYYGGGGAIIINNTAPRFSGVTQHTFGANTVTVHRGAAIPPGHYGGYMGGHHGARGHHGGGHH